MKKLTLALVASAVTVSAASANHIGTGFYLGAAGGYGSTTAKLQGQNAAGSIGNADMGSGQGNIGIFGGYGYVTGCLYIGGEIGYTFESTKINSNLFPPTAGGQTQLKRNGYASAALRGGYLFTANTLGYVRLAGNVGKWTLNDNFNVFSATNPGSGSKNTITFAPGVGLETAVHKNVYLRVEYNYEFGPNVRATNGAMPNLSISATTIRNQSGKVGLAYKF